MIGFQSTFKGATNTILGKGKSLGELFLRQFPGQEQIQELVESLRENSEAFVRFSAAIVLRRQENRRIASVRRGFAIAKQGARKVLPRSIVRAASPSGIV